MGTYIRFMMGVFVLYITPVLILILLSRQINNHFKKVHLKLKAADLLVPFLLMGIHLFSYRYAHVSYFPYFLLFLFTFGMILALSIYVKKEKLKFVDFFLVWWRFVFLFSFFLFYISGGLLISQLL